MSQHKSTKRRSLRSALANKKLADSILDALADMQSKWNSTMDKLDADDAAALDTDYAATGSITSVFEADNETTGAQNKQSFRKSLRSALAHKKLADEICDAIEEASVAYNAMLVKLDAEAGVLASTDWVSSLGLELIGADSVGTEAQHKASFRRSLQSALAHKRLANEILDAVSGIQNNMNASLAALDNGDVNGEHAGFKVTAIDPDTI